MGLAQSSWLTLFGAMGIGLVWGWLLGMWFARVRQLLRLSNLGVLVTGVIGAIVLAFTNIELVLAFLVSAVVSLVLHLVWRRILAQRYTTTSAQGGKS